MFGEQLFENCSKLKELNVLYSWSSMNSNSQGNDTSSSNSLANASYQQFTNSLLYLPSTLETLILFRPSIKEPQVLIDALKRLKCLRSLSLHCVECITDQALTQVCNF